MTITLTWAQSNHIQLVIAVQHLALVGNTRESIVNRDRVVFSMSNAVIGNRLVLREKHHIDRMILNSGNPKQSVNTIQYRDR